MWRSAAGHITVGSISILFPWNYELWTSGCRQLDVGVVRQF